ncbi:MAG TPA: hypothetical protein VHC21_03590 [Candidatus Saccharimonadales bacterium]|nr:hypothetical protein [Candidatus Saccharimonadales bacterium]
MEKSSQNYHSIPRSSAANFLNPHQLPLYGVVYNPEEEEYQYTISGLVRPESELTAGSSKNEIEDYPGRKEAYEPPFNIFLGV